MKILQVLQISSEFNFGIFFFLPPKLKKHASQAPEAAHLQGAASVPTYSTKLTTSPQNPFNPLARAEKHSLGRTPQKLLFCTLEPQQPG